MMKIDTLLADELARDGLLDIVSERAQYLCSAQIWPQNFGNYVLEFKTERALVKVLKDRSEFDILLKEYDEGATDDIFKEIAISLSASRVAKQLKLTLAEIMKESS
jgi:hypothetical protein